MHMDLSLMGQVGECVLSLMDTRGLNRKIGTKARQERWEIVGHLRMSCHPSIDNFRPGCFDIENTRRLPTTDAGANCGLLSAHWPSV